MRELEEYATKLSKPVYNYEKRAGTKYVYVGYGSKGPYLMDKDIKYYDVEDLVPDLFHNLNTMVRVKLASNPDKPNVNGYTYSKDKIMRAINDPKPKAVKCFAQTDDKGNLLYPTDYARIIGKMKFITNKYLYATIDKEYQTLLPCEPDKLAAYGIYVADNVGTTIIKIVDIDCFNLQPDSLLPESYWRSLDE
jgi:hypothetical protein